MDEKRNIYTQHFNKKAKIKKIGNIWNKFIQVFDRIKIIYEIYKVAKAASDFEQRKYYCAMYLAYFWKNRNFTRWKNVDMRDRLRNKNAILIMYALA